MRLHCMATQQTVTDEGRVASAQGVTRNYAQAQLGAQRSRCHTYHAGAVAPSAKSDHSGREHYSVNNGQ
jgi:hypothetical protein